MVTYRQFFEKLSSEQKQTFAAIQKKAIDLSADIAKLIDDTKGLLTDEEGKGIYDQDTEDAYLFANTISDIFGRYLSRSDNSINGYV